VVFAEPLVATLYQRGAFQASHVHATALAVAGYGVGLLGIVSIRVLAPGYFARQDTRTPVRVGVAVLVLTQLFNLVFVFGLHFGVAGLALSTGLGAMVNAGVLLLLLWRRGSYRPGAGWPLYLARLAVASAVMGGGLWWAGRRLDWIGMHEALRAATMAGVLAGAGVLYFGTLVATGLKLREFARRR